jgi:hypothetical protein
VSRVRFLKGLADGARDVVYAPGQVVDLERD